MLVFRAIASASLVVSAAGPALAQPVAAPPYRPVFGGAAVAGEARQTLDISVNLSESYDNDVLADEGSLSGRAPRKEGFYTSFYPTVDFSSHGDHLQIGISAGSNARYYPDVDQVVATTHFAGVGIDEQFTPRTALKLNSGVTYAPAYLYGLFPRTSVPGLGDVVPPAVDYVSNNQHSYAYSTTAELKRQLSPRADVTFSGEYRYTDFVDGPVTLQDFRSYEIGGRYTYAIDRNVKLRIGYAYRNTFYRVTQQPIENSIEAGVEYVRPLSPSRRTQFGITAGPTLVTGPIAAGRPDASQYRLVGDAFLDHQIGRTWHVRGAYRRGLGYVEGVPAPVYADGATLRANGFLNQRADLQFVAAYAAGNLAQAGQPANVVTYTGDARLRVGLTHELAAYVEGLYYQYEFDRTLLLAPGLPHEMKRTGARAGIIVWFRARSR